MSITPTISKNVSSYTVVGGTRAEEKRSHNLTILLLNRGGRFHREELLKEVLRFKNTDILYVEGPELSFDIEPLSRKYPPVRFLLLKENISTGEKINLGFEESFSNYVLVMWSDMKILSPLEESHILCTVPLFKNRNRGIIPTMQVPGFLKKRLQIIPWKGEEPGDKSLYPFDYCGIYNKEKFQSIGGFDPLIINPHWQKLDFGFRSWLWGEEIALNPAFSIVGTLDYSTDDNTPDGSYKRFHLKNLSVKYKYGGGLLSYFKFLTYMLKSDTGPIQSLAEFKEARIWVRNHREYFKQDVKTLIKQWEPPES